jgi:diguanylate cyclase (GGDEF)-like protein
MANGLSLLRAITETLDSLGIAACTFDEDDRALLWNRSFLEFFPEHAADIHVGEPYRANLRRFYAGRLAAGEMPSIEKYVEEGVARHRAQQRPFSFVHNGNTIWVSSVQLAGIGRMRVWKKDELASQLASELKGSGSSRNTVDAPPVDSNALFDHVADGVMVTDPLGHIVWVNRPFVLMYGYEGREAAIGATVEDAYRNAWDLERDSRQELYEHGLMRLQESKVFSGAPFELPLPQERCALVTGQRSPNGNAYFVHVDITALKLQQRQLLLAEDKVRQSEELLKVTLERMEQGIMMVNAERIVEVCNRRAVELLDLPPELMASRPTFEQVLEYQWATDEFVNTSEEVKEFVRAGGILDQAQRYDRKRPDGRVIEVHSVPIEGGGVLRTYTDITERKKHEEHIRHLARHDGLTSLVTREVFLECLSEAVRSAKEHEPTFAVHYIDLDRFKPINDEYGHLVGDKALTLLADRMRQLARDADVVARMGGDEFAILQYRVEDSDRALGLARRILEGLARPIEIMPHRLQVGASIGIALHEPGTDADTILRNADTAMYAAKAAGRDCVRVFGTDAITPATLPRH